MAHVVQTERVPITDRLRHPPQSAGMGPPGHPRQPRFEAAIIRNTPPLEWRKPSRSWSPSLSGIVDREAVREAVFCDHSDLSRLRS